MPQPPDLDPADPALSTTRPLFVDNRDGNSLDRALARHLRALEQESALPYRLDIASAFFNLPGFDLLAADLERIGKVRLLMGAEPKPEAERLERQPGDPPEPDWSRLQVAQALESLDHGLRRQRDLLPFDEPTDQAVRRLLEFLDARRPRLEVRRCTSRFLHAKAYIFRLRGGGAVVGSSNFTRAGLRNNLELNLGHYEDPVVGKVEEWFDRLWEDAEPFDLAAVYDRLMAEYDPYLIFMRVLWELYGAELEEEAQETTGGEVPVTNFQRHGIWRALRIMRRYGGVLIADGVGLGKTFIAGEIIHQYRMRRQRVLLICPAALRDSTWKEFQDRFDLKLTCVSYEQLAQDRAFGGDGEALGSYADEYQLVVIDESHAYRNPAADMRAGILRQLLSGQRRDLLLLSATPVNNSLWDLYHLLRYFIRQDAVFADQGILSMQARFNEAEREDPDSLSPDQLYPIIDATTVKRTRRFIKKHYPDDLITLPGGQRLPISFPKPIASSIRYKLEDSIPGFVDDLEEALGPPRGHALLKLARYQPGRYRLDADDEEEERRYRAIVGLLRSGLLSALASAIGATHRIELKRGWTEPAILWCAIIGESGTAKSPALELALCCVRKRQREVMAQHAEAMAEHAEALAIHERDAAAWKQRKGDGSSPPVKPEAPTAERFWTDDCTVEALAMLLAQNQRGLLMARDELAGWLGGFDRYTGGRGDSAKWLEMHGGRPLVVDRKTSGTIYVPRAAVSITGSIQPDTLRRHLGREHFENGLAARLLVAMPPRRRRRWTETEPSPYTESAAAAVFDRLFALRGEPDEDGGETPRTLRLSPDGKRAWIAFYNAHAAEQAELMGDLAAAWSKLEGGAARIALVIHLSRVAADDPTLADPERVDAESIGAGVTLARWFGAEARRVYAAMEAGEANAEQRRLVGWIRRKEGSVTARDLTRSLRAYPDTAAATAALRELAAAGYGRWTYPPPGPSGGQPSAVFRLANAADADDTPPLDSASRGSVGVGVVGRSATSDGFEARP